MFNCSPNAHSIDQLESNFSMLQYQESEVSSCRLAQLQMLNKLRNMLLQSDAQPCYFDFYVSAMNPEPARFEKALRLKSPALVVACIVEMLTSTLITIFLGYLALEAGVVSLNRA